MVCSTIAVLPLFVGGDASMYITYSDAETGEPIDISTDYEIFMTFINPKTGAVIKEIEVDNGITIQEEIGEYIADPGDIIEWPIGDMPVDILYVNRGKARPTNRFILDIQQNYSIRA